MARLIVDGTEIAYEMVGEGVSLLFLHQAATDQRIWQQQCAHFRQRYRVITVDLFGHGRVPWPTHAISIERGAHCLQHFMERVQTGPAFIIGVSMGAAVAVQMAFQTPDLVRGLGLVSPWSAVSGDMHQLISRLFRLAEAGDMAGHTALLLRYCFPTTSAPKHPLDISALRTIILEQQAAAVAYTWVACLACDLRMQLGHIHTPSLIITGLNDLFSPPYLAREVAQTLSHVELEVWEETGHFAFLEDPERFNRRLELFITRSLTSSTSIGTVPPFS